MLEDSLSLDLNPLCDSGAATNLHGNFPESRYFIVLHEVAVFHQRLIVILEVVKQ